MDRNKKIMDRFNKRRTLLVKLIWAWIEKNRPDVMDAARDEVDKQFPQERTRRNIRVSLPKSMENMK